MGYPIERPLALFVDYEEPTRSPEVVLTCDGSHYFDPGPAASVSSGFPSVSRIVIP